MQDLVHLNDKDSLEHVKNFHVALGLFVPQIVFIEDDLKNQKPSFSEDPIRLLWDLQNEVNGLMYGGGWSDYPVFC
jgi:hypothetical protein